MEFRIKAPGAHQVELASDAFGWDIPQPMHREGDVWTYWIDLPEDARLEYQFVVDGTWHLDPGNRTKVENGFGGYNSVYIGPEYYSRVNDSLPVKPMRSVKWAAYGPNGRREITAYRPVGRYQGLPIMIFADGTEYLRRVKPHYILQNLAEKGVIGPMITVFVPPIDRMKEYLHNSGPYEEWVVHSLLEEVRRRMPASSDPADVFVCGASLGGLISLRLLQNQSSAIRGGVLSQSGAFWASPGAISRAALLKIPSDSGLYFDWGNFEGVLTRSNERLQQMLHRLDLKFEHVVTPEGHNWSAWRGRFTKGASYLLKRYGKGTS